MKQIAVLIITIIATIATTIATAETRTIPAINAINFPQNFSIEKGGKVLYTPIEYEAVIKLEKATATYLVKTIIPANTKVFANPLPNSVSKYKMIALYPEGIQIVNEILITDGIEQMIAWNEIKKEIATMSLAKIPTQKEEKVRIVPLDEKVRNALNWVTPW